MSTCTFAFAGIAVLSMRACKKHHTATPVRWWLLVVYAKWVQCRVTDVDVIALYLARDAGYFRNKE